MNTEVYREQIAHSLRRSVEEGEHGLGVVCTYGPPSTTPEPGLGEKPSQKDVDHRLRYSVPPPWIHLVHTKPPFPVSKSIDILDIKYLDE